MVGRRGCVRYRSTLFLNVFQCILVSRKARFGGRKRGLPGIHKPQVSVAVKCHICSIDVDQVRSVILRQWPAEYESWGVTKPAPKAGTPAYEQYVRNMAFRRAFICECCYLAVDGDPSGCAEIPGVGKWNLASRSRSGRAAVYDRAKWERFQRSKAKWMGISY